MTLQRAHFLPAIGPKVTEGNWILVAQRDFDRRARCRRQDWGAATSKVEDVDCKACVKLMTPEELRERNLKLGLPKPLTLVRASEQRA